MKRILLAILISFLAVSICFAWSENVCQSEAWSVKYDGLPSSGRTTSILVESLTGQAAFKVTVTVYFYDYFGNLVGTARHFHPGPIFKQIPFTVNPPQNTQKITATVFNTWEYGQ